MTVQNPETTISNKLRNSSKTRTVDLKRFHWVKLKFSFQDFLSKYEQIRIFLWIYSHLLKRFLTENFFVLCFLTTHNNFSKKNNKKQPKIKKNN